jgi:murein hydrolase activator
MKNISLVILIFCGFLSLHAQSKKELENEQKKISIKIEKTNKNLESTVKSKQSTIKSLTEIKSKVDDSKKNMNDISFEIKASDKKIGQNNNLFDSLSNNLNQLNQQYFDIQRFAYFRKLSNNKWSYILSSANINTFLMRWRYLNQFDAFTKNKHAEITKLQEKLGNSNEFIEKVKEEKAKQLEAEKMKSAQFENEKLKKDELLKEMTTKEEILLAELRHQKVESEKVKRSIERMINEELVSARNRSNARKNSSSEKERSLDDAEVKLGNDFGTNKKKLPWPVSSGNIVSKFGNQAHASLKGVVIENNGIDIKSKGGREVKAIFEGEVAGVTKISGNNYMVILRHGNYYSVYSNLESIFVSKNTKIKLQQAIGNISADENGISLLHFELWKDKSKLNPQNWLK